MSNYKRYPYRKLESKSLFSEEEKKIMNKNLDDFNKRHNIKRKK